MCEVQCAAIVMRPHTTVCARGHGMRTIVTTLLHACMITLTHPVTHCEERVRVKLLCSHFFFFCVASAIARKKKKLKKIRE